MIVSLNQKVFFLVTINLIYAVLYYKWLILVIILIYAFNI